MTAPIAVSAALAELASCNVKSARRNSPKVKRVHALGKVMHFRHFAVATNHR
jgi:hypothetical protein